MSSYFVKFSPGQVRFRYKITSSALQKEDDVSFDI